MMTRLLLVVISLLLIFPNSILANVDVEIFGNGPGSKSKVSIENNINSSTTTSQKSTGTTDIRIETNGEVKEYHGEGNESVYLESGNGNNSVSISNGTGVEIKEKNSSASATISAEVKVEKTEEGFNIIAFIKNQFDSIIKIFIN